MCTAHLWQTLLHATPVDPTTQLMPLSQIPLSHQCLFPSVEVSFPSLRVALGLLLGVLADVGEADAVFLPHLRGRTDLQDGICQDAHCDLQ